MFGNANKNLFGGNSNTTQPQQGQSLFGTASTGLFGNSGQQNTSNQGNLFGGQQQQQQNQGN